MQEAHGSLMSGQSAMERTTDQVKTLWWWPSLKNKCNMAHPMVLWLSKDQKERKPNQYPWLLFQYQGPTTSECMPTCLGC